MKICQGEGGKKGCIAPVTHWCFAGEGQGRGLLGYSSTRGQLRMHVSVPRGRYLLRERCSKSKPKPFCIFRACGEMHRRVVLSPFQLSTKVLKRFPGAIVSPQRGPE